jgi:transposase InsO family protein
LPQPNTVYRNGLGPIVSFTPKVARPGKTLVCDYWRERRRFGYRRLGWLLAREGWAMNRKKLYRIYREEKLMVRRPGRRKRAVGACTPRALPDAINRRWSLDFVSDALGDGRRFRILCVVDSRWRDDYSYRRPHSSLGALTLFEFARLKTEDRFRPPAGENHNRLYL